MEELVSQLDGFPWLLESMPPEEQTLYIITLYIAQRY